MRRFSVFLITAAVLLFPLSGQTGTVAIEDQLHLFLPENTSRKLLQDGSVFRSCYNEEQAVPIFTPPFSIAQSCVQSWTKGNPACLIESLYLYKKRLNEKKNPEKISRVLRSLSTLEGLQYYSSSRKKMRTLYEASYCVDDPQYKKRCLDPIDGIIESDFTVYALQKDLTFGENIYRYRFLSDIDSSGFISVNTAALKYSIFTAIQPEDLQISVAVTDFGNSLLIHAVTFAHLSTPSFLRERVQNSFKTRSEAVYSWFIKQYEAAE